MQCSYLKQNSAMVCRQCVVPNPFDVIGLNGAQRVAKVQCALYERSKLVAQIYLPEAIYATEVISAQELKQNNCKAIHCCRFDMFSLLSLFFIDTQRIKKKTLKVTKKCG